MKIPFAAALLLLALHSLTLSYASDILTESFGVNRHRGNLVAIQPWVTAKDYQSQVSFEDKLDSYFQIAKQNGYFDIQTGKTIVVLPEYIGTWLVLVDESKKTFQSKTLQDAAKQIIFAHPTRFAKEVIADFRSKKPKRSMQVAIFEMKAKEMASAYHQTFTHLSKKYGVTVVAGSIVLPPVDLTSGIPVIQKGPLFNTSMVYGDPDLTGVFGRLYPDSIHKMYPASEELGYTTRANINDIPVFNTAAGRLGVLICADSWYKEPYQPLKEKKADFIAVPSFASSDHQESRLWTGHPFDPLPYCFDQKDVNRITNDQAHVKCGLPGNFRQGGVENAIEVFQRGHVFELGSDGRTNLIRDGVLTRGALVDSAAIQNSWL